MADTAPEPESTAAPAAVSKPRTFARSRESKTRVSLLDKLRGPKSTRYLLMFLGAALVIQFLHVMEHVTQSMQVFWWGVPRPMAGGLAGSIFDFPLVHVTYNFAFFIALVWAVAWIYGLGGFRKFDAWGMWALLIAAGIQTYHAGEHVLQFGQELETGSARPPGFIGLFADNVLVHLLLNLIVWLPVVFAFVRFGGLDIVRSFLRRRAPDAAGASA